MSPWALFGCESCSDFLVFNDLDSFEEYLSGIFFKWDFSPNRDLPNVFLRIRLGLWVFGRPQRQSVILITGTCYQHGLPSMLFILITQLVCVIYFFFPLSIIHSWEGNHHANPHLRSEEYLHTLFGILLHGRVVYSLQFMYLLNNLYPYRLMNIYFIVSVIIQYYFIFLLKLFQRRPPRAPSAGSPVPLTYSQTL